MDTQTTFDEGEVFLWYQREYLSAVETNEVVVVEKSRRVGISWADASDSVLLSAAAKDAGGMDSFYIGYNKDMAREYIDACADWIKAFKRVSGEIEEEIIHDKDMDRDITVFRINFPSGFKIEALSSRPANLRGKQGKVTLDEAAFHDNLQGLIKAAIALLMWGGRVSIISTHFGDDNPFNELVKDSYSGKTGYKVLRIDFREALKQGLYRRICQARGRVWTQEDEDAWTAKMYQFYGDAAAEELDVVPSGGAGVFLPRALIEKRMEKGIPILRFQQTDEFTLRPQEERESWTDALCEEQILPIINSLNPRLPCYFGEDFARTGDLTALWVLQEDVTMDYPTRIVVELRNFPFEQQRQLVFYILDRLPRFAFGAFDARGNGQYLAEVALQRYGSERIEAVMLSEKWYRENMPRLKDFFEGGSITIPQDTDIMTDLRMIRVKNGVAKVPDNIHAKGSDGRPRHGDTAIAAALAVYATKQEIVEYGYYPATEGGEGEDSFKWKEAQF